jgi:beta-lactamase class A
MTTRSSTARPSATPRWRGNEAECCLIRFFAKVWEIGLKPRSRARIDRIDNSSDHHHWDVCFFAPALQAADPAIAEIERRYGGRVGVFAVDTGSERTFAHRADQRFLMCSTFKGLLAAHVLARVDAGQESLTRLVSYTEKDLVFTSPVTKAGIGQGALSVETLCQAMMEASDNTAVVLLMRNVGGPEGLTRFVRSLDDTITRIDRFEPESNQSNAVLDTTTPQAIVGSVRKILLGDVLSGKSRQLLEGWIIAAKPGLKPAARGARPSARGGPIMMRPSSIWMFEKRFCVRSARRL